jgi:uncharacterized membrane protein YhaH (DUF805 family)
MQLMLQPYRKYFDFNGRARRSEYWLFVLFMAIVVIVLEAVAAVAAVGGSSQLGPPQHAVIVATSGFFLVTMIPLLAVKFRRLHDSNRSAWWLLIGLVPLLGALVLLAFLLLDGTPGSNRFGPDPKGRGANAGETAAAFS